MILKKFLRVTLWTVAGGFGAVTLLYLVVLAINWRDEPPSEASVKLQSLYDARPSIADADNGYVYAMGFADPPDGDPMAAGMKRMALIRQLTFSPFRETNDFRSGRSPEVRSIIDACGQATAGCLSAFESGEAALVQWLTSEAWLLQRYQRLMAYDSWHEAVPLNANLTYPSYSMIYEGQRLWLATAWQAAGRQDAAAVRELLAQDLRFWRRTLRSSDLLINKMTAAAGVNRHFMYANLVLRRLPAATVSEAIPAEWASEISAAERSMTRCFAAEWVYMNATLRQVLTGADVDAKSVSWYLSTPLYQPQATGNTLAKHLLELAGILDVPLEDYQAALSRAQSVEQERSKEMGPFAGPYNFIGKTLIGIVPNYSSYAARVADVEGVRRAAVLSNKLRSQGVTAERLATALSNSDIRTPHSGEPFEWDAAQGTIVFIGLQPGERGRHALIY